jgi:hypothetical protein
MDQRPEQGSQRAAASHACLSRADAGGVIDRLEIEERYPQI